MTRSIMRTATIALATAALAAPTALARPADTPPSATSGTAAARPNQHTKASAALGQERYYMSYDERAPLIAPQPLAPSDDSRTATADRGIAWATIAIGIAGSLLAIVGITSHTRRIARARITA